MATNTTAVAKQVRAFCLESMEQKKTSFVELPTPTESVNTYNSQTAILDNETVATIHFVPLEKIKFCQIIMPVYVKYALAFLWTILQECPYMGKNR